MFEMNPTVARSMSKYLASPAAAQRLQDFVRRVCSTERKQLGAQDQDDWRGITQMAMYRYWREYRKHKGDEQMWSETVRAKMSLSLLEADVSLVRKYVAVEG